MRLGIRSRELFPRSTSSEHFSVESKMFSKLSFVGSSIDTLPTPAFLLDKAKVEKNCRKMLETAAQMGIKLRAQTKTHKTLEAALLQTGGTKRGLVVSTLLEAEFYANAGFDDILYGYPLMEHHLERNFKLCEKLEEYHLMVTSEHNVNLIISTDPPEGKKWSVFLKVDCGNARCGVAHTNVDTLCKIGNLLQAKSDKIYLKGIYVHCGDSYYANSMEGVEKVRDGTIDTLCILSKILCEHGIQIREWGIGSTPSCSHPGEKMKLLSEIHPGNYVFYDLQQEMLGSCNRNEIACTVITRVIGHYPNRNQILIDAGFSALSEQGFAKLGNSFATIKDYPALAVVKMTQEIGFVEPRCKDDHIDFNSIPIGTVLTLYQYHSCDTASKYPVYYVHQDGVVAEEWNRANGW